MIIPDPALPSAIDPLPHRPTLALGSINTSPPQLRNEKLNDILKSPRRPDVPDIEPVQIRNTDPLLHDISDPLSRPDCKRPITADGNQLANITWCPFGDVRAMVVKRVDGRVYPCVHMNIRRLDLLVEVEFTQIDTYQCQQLLVHGYLGKKKYRYSTNKTPTQPPDLQASTPPDTSPPPLPPYGPESA